MVNFIEATLPRNKVVFHSLVVVPEKKAKKLKMGRGVSFQITKNAQTQPTIATFIPIHFLPLGHFLFYTKF
jgi:hypothetical protein